MRPNDHVRYFIRHKYAWPGGYPLYLLMRDGESLCHACAKDNAKLILHAGRPGNIGLRDGWAPMATQINYEDGSLYCCNCNARIESAYAEDETK